MDNDRGEVHPPAEETDAWDSNFVVATMGFVFVALGIALVGFAFDGEFSETLLDSMTLGFGGLGLIFTFLFASLYAKSRLYSLKLSAEIIRLSKELELQKCAQRSEPGSSAPIIPFPSKGTRMDEPKGKVNPQNSNLGLVNAPGDLLGDFRTVR